MIVLPMPLPCSVIALLLGMVTPVVHVFVPAGRVTIAPSAASLIFRCTSPLVPSVGRVEATDSCAARKKRMRAGAFMGISRRNGDLPQQQQQVVVALRSGLSESHSRGETKLITNL